MMGEEIFQVDCGSNGVQVKQGEHSYEVDYVILAAGFAPNTAMVMQSFGINQIEHENMALKVNSR